MHEVTNTIKSHHIRALGFYHIIISTSRNARSVNQKLIIFVYQKCANRFNNVQNEQNGSPRINMEQN